MDVKTLVTKMGFEVDGAPLERIEKRLEGIAHRLEFLGATEIVKGLYELSERFAGMGEQLISASIAAGTTTDEFQKLAYAASQNAVSQEDFSTGLARLSRTLYEAKEGSEEAQKSFERAGFSPDQVAQLKDGQQAFLALSDKMRGMTDASQRVAVAQSLMGRGSFKMIKLMVQGSDAIKGLGDEADSMGAVIKEGALENLEKLEDTMSGFFLVVRNVSATIGAQFAPAIVKVTHGLERMWKVYGAIITSNIRKWVYDVSYVLGFLYGVFEDVTEAIGNFVKGHENLIAVGVRVIEALSGVAGGALGVLFAVNIVKGGFDRFASAIKAVGEGLKLLGTPFGLILKLAGLLQLFLGTIIARIGLLAVELFPALGEAIFAFGTTLTATPLGLFVAALAAVVLGVQTLWAMMHGKKFSDTWLGQAISGLTSLPGKLKGLYNWFTGGSDADSAATPGDASANGSMTGSRLGLGGSSEDAAAISQVDALMRNADASARRATAGQLKNGLNGLSALRGPAVGASLVPGGTTNSATVSNVFNTEVKINTGGNLTAPQAAAVIKESMAEHQDRMHRQAMRQTQTALVY